MLMMLYIFFYLLLKVFNQNKAWNIKKYLNFLSRCHTIFYKGFLSPCKSLTDILGQVLVLVLVLVGQVLVLVLFGLVLVNITALHSLRCHSGSSCNASGLTIWAGVSRKNFFSFWIYWKIAWFKFFTECGPMKLSNTASRMTFSGFNLNCIS